jgi:hypothetical protein
LKINEEVIMKNSNENIVKDGIAQDSRNPPPPTNYSKAAPTPPPPPKNTKKD